MNSFDVFVIKGFTVCCAWSCRTVRVQTKVYIIALTKITTAQHGLKCTAQSTALAKIYNTAQTKMYSTAMENMYSTALIKICSTELTKIY